MSKIYKDDPKAQEFVRRLSELSRETGFIVMGEGDWPQIEPVPANERTADFGYRLTQWDQIEWKKLT